MKPFVITSAQNGEVPIVVSVPHCGTEIPTDLQGSFKQAQLNSLDDTDWFVHQLYDFAPSMGMTMIHAVYHRWVIDLNRDPTSKPLYSDGRIITGLCPVKAFTGENLYNDDRTEVSNTDIKERLKKYFDPYHEALRTVLEEKVRTFGKVLLWDCHSIRQEVPTIHAKKFPDLVLGDNDGFASDALLIQIASKSLMSGSYSFENNYLFKGGYITRHYGKPAEQQHALQLEMTKVNYMDDSERRFSPERAEKMRDHLKRNFEKLITVLKV